MKKLLLYLAFTLPLLAGSKITVKVDSLTYVVALDTMKTTPNGMVPVIFIAKALNLPDSARYRFVGDDGYHPEKDIPYSKLKYGFINPETRNLKWTSKADLTKCYNVKRVKIIRVVR